MEGSFLFGNECAGERPINVATPDRAATQAVEQKIVERLGRYWDRVRERPAKVVVTLEGKLVTGPEGFGHLNAAAAELTVTSARDVEFVLEMPRRWELSFIAVRGDGGLVDGCSVAELKSDHGDFRWNARGLTVVGLAEGQYHTG